MIYEVFQMELEEKSKASGRKRLQSDIQKWEMKKIKLDKSEKDILAAYEPGKLKSVMTPARKKQIKEVAENTLKKDFVVI